MAYSMFQASSLANANLSQMIIQLAHVQLLAL